jgi:hypothetical protein
MVAPQILLPLLVNVDVQVGSKVGDYEFLAVFGELHEGVVVGLTLDGGLQALVVLEDRDLVALEVVDDLVNSLQLEVNVAVDFIISLQELLVPHLVEANLTLVKVLGSLDEVIHLVEPIIVS